MTVSSPQSQMSAPARPFSAHRPTSKDQLVKDRFVAWLRSLDPTSELGPFVARWLFAGLEHLLDASQTWDEFTTRKPRGPMAGVYWVQVLTGESTVDDELLANFAEDFAEEGADYAVLVSAAEFNDVAGALYDQDSRVLLFGPEYFLRKFAGLIYHPDSWGILLGRAIREMERPEQFSSLSEAQPQGPQQQPRGPRGSANGNGGGPRGGGQGGQGGQGGPMGPGGQGGNRRRFVPKKGRQPAGN